MNYTFSITNTTNGVPGSHSNLQNATGIVTAPPTTSSSPTVPVAHEGLSVEEIIGIIGIISAALVPIILGLAKHFIRRRKGRCTLLNARWRFLTRNV
jgi:hypothetical protein